MSTQFFERQEAQKSYTRWLVGSFVLAFLWVTVVINLVVTVGLVGDPLRAVREYPEIVVWTSLIVIGTMLIASWHKSSQLRAGGAMVARSLGGVPVTPQDSDLKRKRLLNIVEEMAIAARIRKPQVYVLPEEQGINAFAAGHSPDEAAVTVTQGALDKLDREQLQAVIGHEFSHILNGDMRINMRLTAWIFGLFVITDLAMRIMRGRSGGKAAGRLKIVALGVFIAGSVGLLAGRLIQAAVSRRREHLADASAVQFTRNPGALQGAFITMAATAEGSQLQHENSVNVAHMFFANTTPSWASKLGTAWFSTHPPLEERVRALDSRISSVKFRSLVGDERRKIAARASQANPEPGLPPPTPGPAAEVPAPATLSTDEMPVSMMIPPEHPQGAAPAAAAAPASAVPVEAMPSDRSMTVSRLALEETLPSGVRMVAGRALPPDVLRNRLTPEQQFSITEFLAQVEKSSITVQATFVAAMLASEPAKWRTQLTKLAPMLGIELMKETQAQVARIAALAPPSRLPLLSDLMHALDTMDPADRKRLRAVARAFAATVATGDMWRFAVTRMLEKQLAKAVEPPAPMPLPDQAPAVCELFAALAQCRFGVDKQGTNAYRAGLLGLLTAQKWSPFPDELLTPAQLDAALAALSQVHPTGKRTFAEGMTRVLAVGGKLTVPQVELLRAVCMIIDCPLPVLPVDLVYDANAVPAIAVSRVGAAQASAR
ncbi:MAG TPA: M48 family metallopeptidase [Steroidobacteraceae bacterium]